VAGTENGGTAVPRREPSAVVVPALTAFWVAVTGGCLLLAPTTSARSVSPAQALLVVGLFAATQALVVNIQLRREATAVYVSEIPMFLALMTMGPLALVLCRVAGALFGLGVLRRQYQQPHKLIFNATLAAAEAGVAAAVFGVLAQGVSGGHPELRWGAGVLAAAAAAAFTAVGVGVVIGLVEGAVRPGALARAAGEAGVQALPVAAFGVTAWAAWERNPWAGVPIAVVTVILLLGYSAYARLRERHLALERLYRFSQVMSHAPGVDDVLARVLQQAREILHAERARVAFIGSSLGDGDGVEVCLDGRGTPVRNDPDSMVTPGWAVEAVHGDGETLLVRRGSRDPLERAWLDDHGLRDAIMVPLFGEGGPIAVLAVDDRLGDHRGFEAEDVQVLQTVANQAAVALRNGELLDRLRHESLHDPLTGLPNRAALQRELEARLAAPSPRFAVGILDLDSFKDVNDTLGHAQGDELLREVAVRTQSALDGYALVCRLGGDEFALVADDCIDAAAAEHLARRLHQALDAPVLLSGIEVDVSGSLGMALAPEHGSTAGALLKRADQAMYEAKQTGRPVRVFDSTLDTASPSRLALVAELRHAITAGDVKVHVQPKVRASDGVVTGTEALVRWTSPVRGAVAAGDFVPLAERSGLIHPLTQGVLDDALGACATWQQHLPGVGISVNVSVKSLGDDSLVRLVERLLRRHALASGLLTLEITESHIMADPASTLGVLHQLRDAGVRLSVDDFGTGYSSLSYLRRLPVTEVKVDRSFVHRMVHEPDDAAIVRSIVELARTLGLHVVAEGVEDDDTWQALTELGVDEIQGWVVAKAMPTAELAPWVAAHRHNPPQLRAV